MSLFPSDLEKWSGALDLLAGGQYVSWRMTTTAGRHRGQPR
ncbi:DUF5959 family protein [Streptomyces sp. NPDC099088]